MAVGENARPAEAQSLNSLPGKMLIINKEPNPFPTDNPFYTQTTGNNRAIWALGLRNPYSFDVQPDTGRIFINEVGQKTWEKINAGIAGANYGWPTYEGPVGSCTYKVPGKKKRHHKRHNHTRMGFPYTGPLLYAYTHSSGCAITGGAFYNPPSHANSLFPDDYRGDYFFADFCGGWVRRYDTATDTATIFASGDGEFPVDSRWLAKVVSSSLLEILGPLKRYPTRLHHNERHRSRARGVLFPETSRFVDLFGPRVLCLRLVRAAW